MSTPYAGLTPVQAAMYQRMTSDDLLMSMVEGVYDEVPEGAAFPYVAFGGAMELADNAHGQWGRVTVITLDVWSAYPGFAEVNAITYRLQELFDEQPLPATGCRVVAVRHEFGQTLRDPEKPHLRRATTRFRVTTTKE